MKIRNAMKKYDVDAFDLQLHAADEADDDGNEKPDDDPDDEADDESEDPEGEDSDEKKFSQKDVDEAIKKRLARERRKWQREQKKKAESKDDGDDAGDDGKKDDKETKKLKEKAQKAEELELKWTCLEHDVEKTCVDDVLALARVHMNKDKDLDIEDAIDKVLEKYPQFKADFDQEGDDQESKKSWGQRHKKQSKYKTTIDDEIRKQLYGK